MNNQVETPNNFHIPLALLACTIAVLLGSQIGAAKQSTRLMKWQSETLEKQVVQMQAADKQIAEAIKNREEGVVKQSKELQNQLQTLLNEMLELAKDDKDAQEIMKKWNVQRNTPPPAADAPATPAPAPGTGKNAP